LHIANGTTTGAAASWPHSRNHGRLPTRFKHGFFGCHGKHPNPSNVLGFGEFLNPLPNFLGFASEIQRWLIVRPTDFEEDNFRLDCLRADGLAVTGKQE
jgi:hypothetical protein